MVSSEAAFETAGLAAGDTTAHLHAGKTEQDVHRKTCEECFHSDFSKTARRPTAKSEIWSEQKKRQSSRTNICFMDERGWIAVTSTAKCAVMG